MDIRGLPLDILSLIIDILPKRGDKLNLALTCRDLYDLLEPYLFQNVELAASEECEFDDSLINRLTVHNRAPQTINYIRSLSFRVDWKPRRHDQKAGLRAAELNTSIAWLLRILNRGQVHSLTLDSRYFQFDYKQFRRIVAPHGSAIRKAKFMLPMGANSKPYPSGLPEILETLGQLEELTLTTKELPNLGIPGLPFGERSSNDQRIPIVRSIAAYKCLTRLSLYGMYLKEEEDDEIGLSRLGFCNTLKELTLDECYGISKFTNRLLADGIQLERLKFVSGCPETTRIAHNFISALSGLKELYIFFLYSLQTAETTIFQDLAYEDLLDKHQDTLQYLSIHCRGIRVRTFPGDDWLRLLNDDPGYCPNLKELSFDIDEDIDGYEFAMKDVPVAHRPSLRLLCIDCRYNAVKADLIEEKVWRMCTKIGRSSISLPTLSTIVVRRTFSPNAVREEWDAWTVEWRKGFLRDGYMPSLEPIPKPVLPALEQMGVSIDKCLSGTVGTRDPA